MYRQQHQMAILPLKEALKPPIDSIGSINALGLGALPTCLYITPIAFGLRCHALPYKWVA